MTPPTVTLTDAHGVATTITLEAFRLARGYPVELYGTDQQKPHRNRAAKVLNHLNRLPGVCRHCHRGFTWRPAQIRHEQSCKGKSA